jgi:hypothetical protein
LEVLKFQRAKVLRFLRIKGSGFQSFKKPNFKGFRVFEVLRKKGFEVKNKGFEVSKFIIIKYWRFHGFRISRLIGFKVYGFKVEVIRSRGFKVSRFHFEVSRFLGIKVLKFLRPRGVELLDCLAPGFQSCTAFKV